MGYSRLVVSILFWTITLHSQQAHALRCYTCFGQGCRNPIEEECPPFTDSKCYVVAVSDTDNTPDRMGCARNCDVVTGFMDSIRCSVCATNLCNRDLLRQGGSGYGSSWNNGGIGSGAGVNSGDPWGGNNDGWNNGQNNNGGGIGSGAGYGGDNGRNSYGGSGIGNGAGSNGGNPYYGNNGNNGNYNPYDGQNNGGIGNGAGVGWNDQGDPYYGGAVHTSSSILALIMLLVIAALF